jgi:Secreted repeat of unknown function
MNTKLTGIAGAFAATLWLTGAAHGAGMLTAEDGMTLYTFDKDKDGASSCYDDCALYGQGRRQVDRGLDHGQAHGRQDAMGI